ncbi:DUF3011 domain-containing protein [Aeromonas aquatilis]
MKKSIIFAITLMSGLSVLAFPSTAEELACSSDGNFNRCPLPSADKMKVKLTQKLEGTCKKDYSWGADSDGIWVDSGCSAVFSYKKNNSSATSTMLHKESLCPSGMDGNNCEYFKDGLKAGKEDRAAGLSNAYQRHSDSFDSRFESSFSKGYEHGWRN